jgi:hypothetical protein
MQYLFSFLQKTLLTGLSQAIHVADSYGYMDMAADPQLRNLDQPGNARRIK